MSAQGDSPLVALASRVAQVEADVKALGDMRAERDHAIGEAHRYKGLYQSVSARSDIWFRHRGTLIDALVAIRLQAAGREALPAAYANAKAMEALAAVGITVEPQEGAA